MPTHVTDVSTPKYQTEHVKAYLKALLYLAELPKYWSKYNSELENFFDRGHPVIMSRPPEFEEFCQAYEEVYRATKDLGLEQEHLNERKLRALARNLYYGSSRRYFYARFLRGRLTRAESITEPPSVIEVEERYQYYLYRKENRAKGYGIGPNFKTWKEEGGCAITFYSIMSLKK